LCRCLSAGLLLSVPIRLRRCGALAIWSSCELLFLSPTAHVAGRHLGCQCSSAGFEKMEHLRVGFCLLHCLGCRFLPANESPVGSGGGEGRTKNRFPLPESGSVPRMGGGCEAGLPCGHSISATGCHRLSPLRCTLCSYHAAFITVTPSFSSHGAMPLGPVALCRCLSAGLLLSLWLVRSLISCLLIRYHR
jgi:hypothetical protein